MACRGTALLYFLLVFCVKEIDVLQGADTVKFTKSSRIRWYGHVERMQNQIAATTIEGTRQRGRPRKKMEGRR
jgi:hypothetical protein